MNTGIHVEHLINCKRVKRRLSLLETGVIQPSQLPSCLSSRMLVQQGNSALCAPSSWRRTPSTWLDLPNIYRKTGRRLDLAPSFVQEAITPSLSLLVTGNEISSTRTS